MRPSGTAHNRLMFIAAARRALRQLLLQLEPAPGASPRTSPRSGGGAADAPPSLSSAAAGPPRLTAGDCHSLLQMLCPDWPPGPVHSAWSSARALQAAADAKTEYSGGGGGSGGTSACRPRRGGPPSPCAAENASGGATVATVGCGCFLAALEVTWLYEHYFLALRVAAFDDGRACELMG
jgi:hypothetical protein